MSTPETKIEIRHRGKMKMEYLGNYRSGCFWVTATAQSVDIGAGGLRSEGLRFVVARFRVEVFRFNHCTLWLLLEVCQVRVASAPNVKCP